jgi:hypothetical protein
VVEKDVILIALHGMGETDEAYADPLWRELMERLGPGLWGRVYYDSIYYQALVQPHQQKLWARMRQRDLDWTRLRQFLLYGFSDAAWLDYKAHEAGSGYEQSQALVLRALATAYERVGDKPVVIVAQSLGGHVISNYLWDAQASKPSRGIWLRPPGKFSRPQEAFLRLKSLRQLYTTGCSIPIFVAGFPKEKIIAVATSAKGYSFRWKNFYDQDDVLGWPLKPLSDSYRAAVDRDYAVNSGGLLRAWNPWSHTRYWTDREVTDRLAGDLRGLMDG